MSVSTFIGGAPLWKERADKSIIMILNKTDVENLYITPLGKFSDNVMDYLTKKGILQAWIRDGRFYQWADQSGYKLYQELKKNVHRMFIKGNRNYDRQKGFWSDIDYITSAMFEKYNFVVKDNFKSIQEYNVIVDNIKLTEKNLEDIKLYREWEKENENFLKLFNMSA